MRSEKLKRKIWVIVMLMIIVSTVLIIKLREVDTIEIPSEIKVYMNGKEYLLCEEEQGFKKILEGINQSLKKKSAIKAKRISEEELKSLREEGKCIELSYDIFECDKFNINDSTEIINYDKIFIPLNYKNEAKVIYLGDEEGYTNDGIDFKDVFLNFDIR